MEELQIYLYLSQGLGILENDLATGLQIQHPFTVIRRKF